MERKDSWEIPDQTDQNLFLPEQKQRLTKPLEQQLSADGIILNKRPADEILNKIKKLEDYQDFMGLIYTFLNLIEIQ